MANIDTRSLWLFGYKGSILENKQMLIDSYFKYMTNEKINRLKKIELVSGGPTKTFQSPM